MCFYKTISCKFEAIRANNVNMSIYVLFYNETLIETIRYPVTGYIPIKSEKESEKKGVLVSLTGDPDIRPDDNNTPITPMTCLL